MPNPGVTEFIDNTSADVFIPELWSLRAIVQREQALVYGALVDTQYREDLTKGDRVHVPSVGDLATRSKSENTAITYETILETQTTIIVDQHKYVAIAVESITKVQADRNMLELYAGKLGYALALDVDDVLAGLPDDATNKVGTLAVENTDDELIRARQFLNDANVPMSDRYFVFSPAAESGLLKLDRFIHNDYAAIHGEGARELAVERAYMTSFYRIPIYMSTNVEGTNAAGHDNTLFNKQAWALIMQLTPDMHSQFDIDFFADKVAIEQLYGTKEMRDDHAVWIQGA